jgi:hypothetical protein
MPRPLLICDADEVLVAFAAPFKTYLLDNGYQLKFDSFALGGNVRAPDGTVVSHAAVSALVDMFFDERVEACTPVPGAVDALAQLSVFADIQILSNVPAVVRDRRAASLAGHGMAYPVMANVGGKGPAVADLVAGRGHPVVFVDDMPSHHASVADHAPQVHRLHLVADPSLRGLIPAAPAAHARIDDWAEALPYVRAALLDIR